MSKVKLKEVLKQYRITHWVEDRDYKQVTISQTGEVSYRGTNHGSKIGRKRQFIIDLKNHPKTLIFIRQGVYKGGIGICPKEVDGCIVTENMPMFDIVNINPEYLLYFTKSKPFIEQVDKLVPLGTAQKALHEKQLLEVEIPLPSSKEQEEIVRKLKISTNSKKELDSINSSNESYIANLRQSILQEAVQGKLVPQNPKDEPASELLKKIKAEKEKLIKEGKIRKDKPLPPISDEEKPYDLPKGWEWVRLGEICKINPRNNLDNNLEVAFIPMNLIEDGFNNKHLQEIRRWSEIKSGFTHFAEDDVVFAKITPCFQNRKSAVLKNLKNKHGAGTTELHVLRSYAKTILPEILLYLVKTDEFIKGGVSTYTGTAGQQRVKREFFEQLVIGLPPLSEQTRIVEKVDKLIALCDELEKQVKENQENAEKLMGAVLKESFA